MITTTSELSSQFESTPGARLANEPPTTPPRPGERGADEERDRERALDVDAERAHHRAVVDAGADHHAGARLLQPEPEQPRRSRARAAGSAAAPRSTATPATCRFTKWSIRPGHVMPSEMPPKWSSIWSAKMIETAIVISAWRRSSPWFQRSRNCCMHDADHADEQRAGDERDDPVDDADLRAREAERAALADEVALQLERDVAAEQEERAVRHVDDAHQAEDQGEAGRDDEVQARRRDAVQHHDDEVLAVVVRGAEAHVLADEPDPEHDEDGRGDSQPQAHRCEWRGRADAGSRPRHLVAAAFAADMHIPPHARQKVQAAAGRASTRLSIISAAEAAPVRQPGAEIAARSRERRPACSRSAPSAFA